MSLDRCAFSASTLQLCQIEICETETGNGADVVLCGRAIVQQTARGIIKLQFSCLVTESRRRIREWRRKDLDTRYFFKKSLPLICGYESFKL